MKIEILYLALYNQLKKKFGTEVKIPKRELYYKLGMHSHVPKPLREKVLKEMEDMNLLRSETRDYFILIELNIDIEKESDKLFEIING